MSLSLYQVTVPVFEQMLNALSGILGKAAAHAAAKKIDPSVLLNSRLSPDMLPLSRQIQIAADFAKLSCARLAAVDPPKHPDEEATLEALRERIAATLKFVHSLDRPAIDAAEARTVIFPVGPNKMKMIGSNYMTHFVLPNFFFHTTTAYAILRHCGVEIGKRDFMGAIPGFGPT